MLFQLHYESYMKKLLDAQSQQELQLTIAQKHLQNKNKEQSELGLLTVYILKSI